MRYGKLCSSDYPLVMTILDAVSQGYAVLEIYSLILEMPSQRTCVTSCHFRHNRFSIWNPLKTKNRAWKVQRFLNSPNLSSFRAVSGLHPPEHRHARADIRSHHDRWLIAAHSLA